MADYREEERYKGLMPEDPGKLGRGTMSSEEFRRWQGENGDHYRGMAETPAGELGRRTMSSEEFRNWQGENGDIYRGMAETPAGELGRRTMSSEEFRRWQGENGDIYRGMMPEDPDKYRQQTTGATNPEIANLVTQLSQLDLIDQESVGSIVDQLLQEPESVSKLMELRMRKASDFLYSWGDYNLQSINTDIALLTELMNQGYDFSTFSVDLSFMLGEKPQIADFNKYVDYYNRGLTKARANGKNTLVDNPLQPGEKIQAQQVLEALKNNYQQTMQHQEEMSMERTGAYTRTMGFSQVFLLGLLSAALSFGIIVLGVLLQ